MGHNYGVPLRFLSITPTRDNDEAPGNRLSDKHSKLFHGKTLDEWLMIQLSTSKYLGKAIFVCETEKHADRLMPLATRYNVTLYVRPRDMLNQMNDSGAIILQWATRKALDEEFYTLVTHPFVVAPCRSPGFFDRMVDAYSRSFDVPDRDRKAPYVMGGHEMDAILFDLDSSNVGTMVGETYYNKNPRRRLSTSQHYMAHSSWWMAYMDIVLSKHDISFSPTIFDIEPWEDIHIDTQDEWDWAAYWFEKKILSQGEDCYERYRTERNRS